MSAFKVRSSAKGRDSRLKVRGKGGISKPCLVLLFKAGARGSLRVVHTAATLMKENVLKEHMRRDE